MTRGGHTFHSSEVSSIQQQQLAGAVEAPANIGKSAPMSTQNVAGGVRLAETQLISQRLQHGPRQLIVTLAPIAKGPNNPTPWYAPWNGTSTDPQSGPQPFGAPALPDPGKGLRVSLRFGAGGAATVTEFDYPAAGACFGITADTLDVRIVPQDAGDPKVYTSTDDVPFVGAWFVEGQAADPTPLQWAEVPVSVGEVGVVYFSVKPFARQMELTATTGDVNDQGMQVDWYDTDGALVKRDRVPNALLYTGQTTGAGQANALLEVPSAATYCLVGTGNADGAFFLVTWKIGLV